MDISRIAIATITWARSPGEEALLRRSLTLLANTRCPVAVADTATSAPFAEFLRQLPGFHIDVPSEQGLVPQIKVSLQLAVTLGRPFILYTEPDKDLFFAERMTEFVRLAPDERDVGVVLASRSPESFATFPPMQRYTEGVMNTLCAELIGIAGDYSYGPFLMNGALVPHVQRLQHDVGWGWRPFVFRAAHRECLRLIHVQDDHPCPPGQQCEDEAERAHRIRQLAHNILGLLE